MLPERFPALPSSARGGSRRKYDDERLAEKKINSYLAECRTREKPMTIFGLANALDCSVDTLRRMEKCESGYSLGLAAVVKRAKQIISQQVEEMVLTAKNPAGPIFHMKAVQNWTDQPRTELPGAGGINITLKVVNQAALSSQGAQGEITLEAETAEVNDTKALTDGIT